MPIYITICALLSICLLFQAFFYMSLLLCYCPLLLYGYFTLNFNTSSPLSLASTWSPMLMSQR